MQSLLLVFIGIPESNSNSDLDVLMQRLKKRYEENELTIEFSRKDELLSATLDDAGFYISFLKSKKELEDWYQLARDFELRLDKNPINRESLLKRYEELKKSPTNPYNETHFTTGIAIIEEMEKFDGISILSFQ